MKFDKLHQPKVLSIPSRWACTKILSFPGLGIHVMTIPSGPHTWAVAGCILVETRGPKVGMLSVVGWRGMCGTRQSSQALALCHQQWAPMLSGKLQKKKRKRVRDKDRDPPRRGMQHYRMLIEAGLQREPVNTTYNSTALLECTTLKPRSPATHHSFCHCSPR